MDRNPIYLMCNYLSLKHWIGTCAIGAAMLVLFNLSQAQHRQSAKANGIRATVAQLEQSIPHLMHEGDIPGLAIALIRNGEIAWSRGFGVQNTETKKVVNDETVFEAASLSKPVFAYAVLKLVDKGKLALDTPLTRYLPGKYDVGDDPHLNQITVRQILSHTSGFPNWRPRGESMLKIHFTPGDRFSYSGEGYVYLAKVVEHVTGEAFNAFMKRTVFEPLGMKSSSFVWQDSYEARKTFRHNAVGIVSGRNKPETANAAASLQTTATDYARFVIATIRSTGLKSETARLMLTPQISVAEAGTNNINRPNPKLSPSISWGLGWGLQKNNNGISFWHWGDNGDSKAYIVGSREQKSAVIIFANSSTGLTIINELVEATLGGQQPALAWLNYETYNSPARNLLKAILRSDAKTVLSDYRLRRQRGDQNARLTEAQVNRLGYQLLGLKRVNDAIEVFMQNTSDYPQSFNTWDSLAEAYMIKGDKESAIKYYQKSLELNPDNTNAIQKIKELES